MRDAALIRRSALEGQAPRHFDGLSIENVPETTILLLLGRPGETRAADLTACLGAIAANGFRPAGPGQWFLVLDHVASPAEIDQITRAVAQHAMVVDQSHGRARLRVTGAGARRLLAKGTCVDLHPDAATVGLSTPTAFGHIAIHLSRTKPDSYELLVLRGFAETLWEDLCALARPQDKSSARFGPR
jgi:sarcosine oxidase subunit gamma